MFEKPVLESIARLLSLMAAPPNLRSAPLPGDLSGAFTQWFDGGAISTVAGCAVFEFNDGSRGLVPTPFPHIFIQLASGENLSLSLENARTTEVPRPLGSMALPPDAALAPTIAQPSLPVASAASQTSDQAVAVPEVAQPVAATPPVFAQIETIPPAGKKCQTCSLDNKPGARFCRYCGKPLP